MVQTKQKVEPEITKILAAQIKTSKIYTFGTAQNNLKLVLNI